MRNVLKQMKIFQRPKTLQQKGPKLGGLFVKTFKGNKHNSPYFARKICLDNCTWTSFRQGSRLTVFFESFNLGKLSVSEQLISTDKYPIIQFLAKLVEAIVYIYVGIL